MPLLGTRLFGVKCKRNNSAWMRWAEEALPMNMQSRRNYYSFPSIKKCFFLRANAPRATMIPYLLKLYSIILQMHFAPLHCVQPQRATWRTRLRAWIKINNSTAVQWIALSICAHSLPFLPETS